VFENNIGNWLADLKKEQDDLKNEKDYLQSKTRSRSEKREG
jgi:hypothetical protein